MATEKRKVGRPKENLTKRLSKYTVDTEKIKKLYLAGWTDKQVADFLNISVSAIKKWKQDNKFSVPLKDWKSAADAKVEKCLYQRAMGFEYIETTREPEEIIEYKDGQRVSLKHNYSNMVVSKTVTKHVVPDVTAQIFWLKNRQPQEWRDKRDIDLGLQDSLLEKYKELTADELIQKSTTLARAVLGDPGSSKAPAEAEPA